MRNKIVYGFIIVSILTTSCFEEDEPLQPYSGKLTTIKNHIEYYQSYYDFETDSILGYHNSDAWTLGFGCSENDLLVSTNSGSNWFVYNTQQPDFNTQLSFPQKTIWKYDKQLFFPDSLAIENWISVSGIDTTYTGNVYLIGKFIGTGYSKIFRIKILKVTNQKYVFCFRAESSSETPDTIIVQKLPEKNFVYYSFDDFSVKDLEPTKTAYDIVFGPYYDTVTQLGVNAPYLVRGVLLNSGSSASSYNTKAFEAINEADVQQMDFSSQRNFVGFSWKEVIIDQSTNSATYTIRPNYNYVIKTPEDNYFKFHFLSYTLNGENGYPSFEAERISPN